MQSVEQKNNDKMPSGAPKKYRRKLELRNSAWRANIPMVLFMFAIVIFGLVVLYSVSAPAGYVKSGFTSSAYYVFSQIRFSIVGLVAALIIMYIPVDWFRQRWIMLAGYGLGAFLIILTALFGSGEETHGARRWLTIGGTEFQTSEIFKVAFVLVLAIYRSVIIDLQKAGKLKASNPKKQPLVDAFWEFILPVGAILIVDCLILVQPHLSCFLIIGAVTFVCFLASGIKLRSWFIGITFYLAVALLALAVVFAVPSLRTKFTDYVSSNFAHVAKRIDIFSEDDVPDEESELTSDDTLQVDRAKDAIGTGGMFGLGFGNSRSKYSYVSEAHNDYIFSIYAEETGFIGGTILILIFLLLFYMGFRVAMNANDVYTRIIALGYTFLIVMEALFNIGVELTVLPSTGITLPFFSYGGTAQILLLVSYGMILCVGRSGVVRKSDKEKEAVTSGS